MMKRENFQSAIIIIISIGIIILGFQLVWYKTFNPAIFPFEKGISVAKPFVVIIGALLMISGAAAFHKGFISVAYLVISAILFLSVILAHIPLLIGHIHNANEWTGAFETTAILSSAMLICSSGTDELSAKAAKIIPINIWQYIFALSLTVFGVLHFLYAEYIAQLIPTWIPFRLFWAYFVGLAFIAAAISLLSRTGINLAMSMLGIMFLIWVLIVHAPRVYHKYFDRDEWSSLIIALMISCTAFFILLTVDVTKKRKIHASKS